MEQIAPARLQELQRERLPKTLRWAAEKCAHYRESSRRRGLDPESALKELKAAEDLQALPLCGRRNAGQRALTS